jgi:hypothetical protein
MGSSALWLAGPRALPTQIHLGLTVNRKASGNRKYTAIVAFSLSIAQYGY